MSIALGAWTGAQAGTIHVPADYAVIQDAIDAATAGDVVLVAAGTYATLRRPPGADTTRCVVAMKAGVTLRGAGVGQTIIDPDFGGRGIYCNGVATAAIEGVTV
ncbi:MAG: hypothetical protein KC729_11775, partial [Candidatus Eisenbacteria bacterium]|nr:hypothetical protein [Candidatus Eisenbacteria bacterium]